MVGSVVLSENMPISEIKSIFLNMPKGVYLLQGDKLSKSRIYNT